MAVATQANQANLITEESLMRIVGNLLDDRLASLNQLKEENTKLRKRVAELEDEVEGLQGYSRVNNVVAYGVPKETNEDPIQLAIDLGKTVNLNLKPEDIDIAHRLKSRRDDLPPPFIIKFVNRHKKIELLKRSKPKKSESDEESSDRGTKEAKRGIVFRDHLSPRAQQIFNHAHILWSEYFVWSWKGGIYCRKDGEEEILPLKSLYDVDELAKEIVFEENEEREDEDEQANGEQDEQNKQAELERQNRPNGGPSTQSPTRKLRPRRNTNRNYNTKAQMNNNLSRYGFRNTPKPNKRHASSTNASRK